MPAESEWLREIRELVEDATPTEARQCDRAATTTMLARRKLKENAPERFRQCVAEIDRLTIEITAKHLHVVLPLTADNAKLREGMVCIRNQATDTVKPEVPPWSRLDNIRVIAESALNQTRAALAGDES